MHNELSCMKKTISYLHRVLLSVESFGVHQLLQSILQNRSGGISVEENTFYKTLISTYRKQWQLQVHFRRTKLNSVIR